MHRAWGDRFTQIWPCPMQNRRIPNKELQNCEVKAVSVEFDESSALCGSLSYSAVPHCIGHSPVNAYVLGYFGLCHRSVTMLPNRAR